jgi:cytochrome c oxidase subunit 2
MLEPKGPVAGQISWLSWVFFGLGTAIFLGVLGYLGLALFRKRGERTDEGDERIRRRPVIWGAVLTVVILILLFGLSLNVMRALAEPETDLVIDVTGYQWWWDVRYPEQDFATANEVHIPVGKPVLLRLRSVDVIHSFWVPELAGKMDLIPGRTNTMWLQADQPGVYLGLCAEYCGDQHAKMQFVLVAEPEREFTAWLERQQQPAPIPEQGSLEFEGQQIFLGSGCVYCHNIEGTNASGTVGPDLTHIASRRSLGAGILANNPGNLAGWIVDPQRIKPGNQMPPMDLTGEELQAVLAYMATLE